MFCLSEATLSGAHNIMRDAERTAWGVRKNDFKIVGGECPDRGKAAPVLKCTESCFQFYAAPECRLPSILGLKARDFQVWTISTTTCIYEERRWNALSVDLESKSRMSRCNVFS